MSEGKLRRTPLFEAHVALGGKMVPFAGWEMPVQYTAGVVEEHVCVRERVGLFDVSHMGEIEVRGARTEAFLDRVTCNAVTQLSDGQAQYTALPNEQGGVIDDIIIYRHSGEHFLLCVNASNAERDFEWLKEQEEDGAEVTNVSDRYAQIAVQGPQAFALLHELFQEDLSASIEPFHFASRVFEEHEVLIARTGYTGEQGVEIFVAPSDAVALWNALLQRGEAFGVLPCGLGARDSLRLEVCYPLHGHELSPEVSAIESGLGWIVKPAKKGDFIGRSVLEAQKKEGALRKLVGFFVEDRGIVREETPLFVDGKEVGVVTSGTKTPTVGKLTGKALGLALVQREHGEMGQMLTAQVRGKELACRIEKTPFYRAS
ncbi:glycine cleavage system aminomethyltransferase GcvT [bacterium]|nr:glycine cleavage system aminomethyltransferase GcvT [bacterium]